MKGLALQSALGAQGEALLAVLGRRFPARWVAKKYPDLYTMYYAVSTV